MKKNEEGKGGQEKAEICNLTNPYNNFYKSKWQLWQIMCTLQFGLEKNITNWGTSYKERQRSDLGPIKT